MKSKSDTENTAGGGCSSHGLFARAKVDADPMAFAVRGAVFRGYYVFAPGNYYMTKGGEWTHGCTAPDDGNWWDTRGDAQRALEKFRLANAAPTRPAQPGSGHLETEN